MIKQIQIDSVAELVKMVDIGITNFTVRLAPFLAYTKTIVRKEDGDYLVTSLTKGRVATREQVMNEPSIVKDHIKKHRLWAQV